MSSWPSCALVERVWYPGRMTLRIATVCAAGLGATLATGCSKTLFKDGDVRSQYARYDAVRNQAVPADLPDANLRKRPNLRGRLLPQE